MKNPDDNFIVHLIKKLLFFIRNNTPRKPENNRITVNKERNSEKYANIILLGDITLAHRFNEKYDLGYFSKLNPFYKCVGYFKNAVCIGNLEGAISDSNDKIKKLFNFKGKREYLDILKKANINHVTLANNHVKDFGNSGLFDTLQNLNNFSIHHTGAGTNVELAKKPIVAIENGVKIGIASLDAIEPQFWAGESTCGTASLTKDNLKDIISSLKHEVDIIIIAMHFGEELAQNSNSFQKEYARYAIELGAHIIAGSHSHVIQGVEHYKHGVIFYSLGNFCFGGNSNPRDKDTFFPVIKVSSNGVIEYEIIPCKISGTDLFNDCFPTPQSGNEKHRILKKVFSRK